MKPEGLENGADDTATDQHAEVSSSTQQPSDNGWDTTQLPDPGELHVIRRNQKTMPFERERIANAIRKAFLAERGVKTELSTRDRLEVDLVTNAVVTRIAKQYPDGGRIHVEEIQDKVVYKLLENNFDSIGKRYITYRKQRQKVRESNALLDDKYPPMAVTKEDGSIEPLDWLYLEHAVLEACEGIDGVSHAEIIQTVQRNVFDGISASEIDPALIAAARERIEREPNYSVVAARLLLAALHKEVLELLNISALGQAVAPQAQVARQEVYGLALKAGIEIGVQHRIINPELLNFDFDKLGYVIQADRDRQFNFLGLRTLYDRYLLHVDGKRFELPQTLFMRVAMGLALDENNREEAASQYYELLSNFDFVCSTPTLFNAGTTHSQLSSCYLSTVPDDLDGIYSAIKDNALLSKWAGGLGNDWTPVRALNSFIKGTNGRSQGIVPFLKVVNDTAVAVNQGGKRKGAVCSYLETWHLDIEQFLELRKNTGDDHRRTMDMNTANWVPDLFMKRVTDDAEWTLFSPNDVSDLHDLYGSAFEERYAEYEAMTATGEITLFRKVSAAELWRKMLTSLYETGHPWITFKDPCNIRSPQHHAGVVHSSNLCTEITLNTSAEEIAVCNLGSVNLVNHIDAYGKIDHVKLRNTIRIAITMLDNVIDLNYYAVPTAERSNHRHRPVGLGMMGFQDCLYEQSISYASDEAVDFADESMEAISYYAIEASSDLAVRRGRYASYDGSLWSKGILPIDSLAQLEAERGSAYIEVDHTRRMDWDALRDKVKTQGMRNSNVLAIAPTATIANIAGVAPSIEPTFQNVYTKSNLSGEFLVANQYLVNALKEEGLWDAEMVAALKAADGSVQAIERIPETIKARYKTAFEVGPQWIIEAASRRQKWIDQSQSLNIYMQAPTGGQLSGRKLDVTYRMAWLRGLKTTYYLRALGATNVEKSTLANDRSLNAVTATVPANPPIVERPEAQILGQVAQPETADFSLANPADVPEACSIDDPDCEACQ